MLLKDFIEKYSSAFSSEEYEFLLAHPMDEVLKAKLMVEVKDVLNHRSSYKNKFCNESVLVNICKWWVHHYNVYQCFSKRPEWDFDRLALVFKEGVPLLPDFTKARKLFMAVIYRPNSDDVYTKSGVINLDHSSYYFRCLGFSLSVLMERFFNNYIMEGKTSFKKGIDCDVNIKQESIDKFEEDFKAHPLQGKNPDGNGYFNAFTDAFKTKFPDANSVKKFSDISKYLYTLIYNREFTESNIDSVYDEISEVLNNYYHFLDENQDICLRSIYKELNLKQMRNKVTLINRLCKDIFFPLHLVTCLDEYGAAHFKAHLLSKHFSSYKDVVSLTNLKTVYSFDPIRIHNAETHRYVIDNNLNYNNFLDDKIPAAMNGGKTEMSLIISLHPCDLLTSSLGHNWSSCHSFVDVFDDFIKAHGYNSNNAGNTYHGMYHAGNFNYMTGDALICYEPYDFALPQYMVTKMWRFFTFVSEDGLSIRQNLKYPGKESDPATQATALITREIIQNALASFNNTAGTSSWTSTKSCLESLPFRENMYDGARFLGYTCNSYVELSDPSLLRAYVKDRSPYKPIYIGGKFVRFDMPQVFPSSNNECYLHSDYSMSLTDDDVYNIRLSNGSYITYKNYISDIDRYAMCEDTGLLSDTYNNVIVSSSGDVKHYYNSSDNVCMCSSCKKLFLKSLISNGRCYEHALSVDDVDYLKSLCEQFKSGNVGLLIDDDIERVLSIIYNQSNLNWKSGKKLTDFIPKSKGAVILVDKNGNAFVSNRGLVKIKVVESKEVK